MTNKTLKQVSFEVYVNKRIINIPTYIENEDKNEFIALFNCKTEPLLSTFLDVLRSRIKNNNISIDDKDILFSYYQFMLQNAYVEILKENPDILEFFDDVKYENLILYVVFSEQWFKYNIRQSYPTPVVFTQGGYRLR